MHQKLLVSVNTCLSYPHLTVVIFRIRHKCVLIWHHMARMASSNFFFKKRFIVSWTNLLCCKVGSFCSFYNWWSHWVEGHLQLYTFPCLWEEVKLFALCSLILALCSLVFALCSLTFSLLLVTFYSLLDKKFYRIFFERM